MEGMGLEREDGRREAEAAGAGEGLGIPRAVGIGVESRLRRQLSLRDLCTASFKCSDPACQQGHSGSVCRTDGAKGELRTEAAAPGLTACA